MTCAGPAKSRRQRKEEHKAKLAAKKTAQNTVTAKPVTADEIARVFDAQFEELAEEEWEESPDKGAEEPAQASDPEQGGGEDEDAAARVQASEASAETETHTAIDEEGSVGAQNDAVDEAREVAALLQEENIQLLGESWAVVLGRAYRLALVPGRVNGPAHHHGYILPRHL